MSDSEHDETTAAPDEPARRSSPSDEAVAQDPPGARTGRHAPARRHRRFRWAIGPAIALILVILLRTFVAQPFVIPSASMQPTLEIGDRILVEKFGSSDDLRRGDVIVFDGTKTFGAIETPEESLPRKVLSAITWVVSLGSGTDYVKRIVGMPGDHVTCCTEDGKLSVNGQAVTEPYLYPGDTASQTPFDVTVPAGKIWVMGDHRSRSADSRAHMGDPGGGMVPIDDVIGKVWLRYWPLSRTGSVTPAPGLASIPRSTPNP